MGKIQRFKTYEEASQALEDEERRQFLGPNGLAIHLSNVDIMSRTAAQLRGTPLVPKGLYRFKTFEEADEWMNQMMAETHARHKSRML